MDTIVTFVIIKDKFPIRIEKIRTMEQVCGRFENLRNFRSNLSIFSNLDDESSSDEDTSFSSSSSIDFW